MKHIILDQHYETCLCHKDNKTEKNWLSSFCQLNPERFLFFHNNDFHIITYFNCISFHDKHDFRQHLLTILIDKSDKVDEYEIRRGWQIERDLKKSRLRGLEFDMYIHEVNYIYRDMCGKGYAIATKMRLTDKLDMNDTIEKNYQAALVFLNSDEYLKDNERLPRLLEDLMLQNKVHISEAEIVKSTAHLVKKFKKQIKDKQKLTTNN